MNLNINDDLKSYVHLLGEEIARLVVGFVASVFLVALLLFGARAAWALYSETNVGEVFLLKHDALGSQIDSLFAQQIFEFSFSVSLSVFLYVALIALVMHFLYIRHYLYEPFPIAIKGVWILVVTFFLASVLQDSLATPQSFLLTYTTILPAVLCSLPTFLMVMDHTMPDLVTAMVRTVEWFRDKVIR